MAEQILVPLKRNDRVEEMIPYIEKVTRLGMGVVFLGPYPMDRFMINYRGDLRSHSAAGEIHDSEINWWRDRRISVELERRSRLAQGLPSMHPWENRRHVPEKRFFPVCEYSWENHKRLYQETIFPLCAPLRKAGLEISVDLYTGSLRKVLKNYALNKDVRLIMARGGIGLWIMRFLQRTMSIFGLFKRTECAPMILRRPDRA
jgi:hypothetical protein